MAVIGKETYKHRGRKPPGNVMRKAVVKRSPADMREREVITVREISNNMPLYRRRNTVPLPYAVEPAAM